MNRAQEEGRKNVSKTAPNLMKVQCFNVFKVGCQGHSSLDTPSELNPPQRIPSPLFTALLVPQAEG